LSYRKKPPSEGSFDPWIELIASAFRNNVRQINKFAHQARILFVVKNNAYGLGIREVGPIVDQMDEIYGFAVVRVDEALALREVGVRKPILLMGHVCQQEAAELIRQDVMLTLFHDDAKKQVESLAKAFNQPVPVQLYIETGMNRIGMPYERALPWIEDLAASKAIKIMGTYTMTAGAMRGEMPFDDVQLARFLNIVKQVQHREIELGVLHAAPSRMIVKTPASHRLGIVRPGHAVFGGAIYHTDENGNRIMNLEHTFQLKARVVRVEVVQVGEGVSFGHRFIASKPTWIATIPIGHTDGYPASAAGNAGVLIGGQIYPIIPGGVNANFVMVEVGERKSVDVGEIATLIGTEHPDITPKAVAEKAGLDSDYWLMTKLNPLLLRKVV
jgi:alanine racemase